MGVPYEIKPMVGIDLVDTIPTVVEIPWPHRSVISKILVNQTEGVANPFNVAIYNHSQVQSGVQASDSVGPDIGKITNDMFRVTPDLPANSAGKLLYFSEQSSGGYGFVVFFQEDRSDRQGQKTNKLYVVITATTAGNRTVELLLGGMKEIE